MHRWRARYASLRTIAGARPQRRPLAENAAFRSIYEDLNELHAQNRHTLLTNPINIPMPSLPRISGERKSFKANIRRELEQWRARWPIFQPLLVPLKMTFLVIPSEQGGKDLDNLALEVLPLVHEVLRPQPTSWLLRFPLLTAEDRMEDNRARSRLRFLGVNSVTAFEVIELQRRQRPIRWRASSCAWQRQPDWQHLDTHHQLRRTPHGTHL
jgi:hypothetical protein